MNKNDNGIVKEMAGIIICYGLLLQVAFLFLARRCLYVSSGLWIGIMLAVFMLVYMYRILMAGMGGEVEAVKKYVLRHSVIRYFTVVIVFGIVIFAHLGNPLSCFAGIIGLKVAAYLQPAAHRFLENRRRN